MKGEKMCWSNYRIKCGVKVYRVETSLLKHTLKIKNPKFVKISGQISWRGNI